MQLRISIKKDEIDYYSEAESGNMSIDFNIDNPEKVRELKEKLAPIISEMNRLVYIEVMKDGDK